MAVLERQLFTLRGLLPHAPPATVEPDVDRTRAVRTRTGLTAFDGTSEAWATYLNRKPSHRRDADQVVSVTWDSESERLGFLAESEGGQALAGLLQRAWPAMLRMLGDAPQARAAYRQLVFGNESNGHTRIELRTSRQVPSDGTREVAIDAGLRPTATVLVLNRQLVDQVLERAAALDPAAGDEPLVGEAMPLLMQLLISLGQSSYPRDRFVDRIEVTRLQATVVVNLLFSDRRLGRLVPNAAGERYLQRLSERSAVAPEDLEERHPYLATLGNMGALLSPRRADDFTDQAKIHIRSYLDDRYLRPTVAAAVPELSSTKLPMRCLTRGRHAWTPKPELGRNGVVDTEDLRAWRAVEGDLDNVGLRILRQLGMGQFGRVYEAVNLVNASLPRRVAVKIDRLRRSETQIIQDPVHAMELGNRLALAPHVIRIFDTGRLPRTGLSYHVLQLVEGETMDDLLGVTGQEHASVDAFTTGKQERETERTVRVAMSGAHGELWRLRGHVTPFAEHLDLGRAMDILGSVLLWLEEIHALGFAINDLKNGNLMLSRRGQLKGIDLDSYAPVFNPIERMVDFKFFGISALLYVLNASEPRGFVPRLDAHSLANRDTTAALLREHWQLGDAEELSSGRIGNEDVIALMAEMIACSNDNSYTFELERFSADVERFTRLKRTLLLEEIVLD